MTGCGRTTRPSKGHQPLHAVHERAHRGTVSSPAGALSLTSAHYRHASSGWGETPLGVVTVDVRVEHVGSLLRRGFLRDARARGELTPAGLKAAEDRAVREVVAMQEEVGLPAAAGV